MAKGLDYDWGMCPKRNSRTTANAESYPTRSSAIASTTKAYL